MIPVRQDTLVPPRRDRCPHRALTAICVILGRNGVNYRHTCRCRARRPPWHYWKVSGYIRRALVILDIAGTPADLRARSRHYAGYSFTWTCMLGRVEYRFVRTVTHPCLSHRSEADLGQVKAGL
jgi:hypothetical protein